LADGRKNNGGHSTKGAAGRPSKSDEEKVVRLALGAMTKVFGSPEKCFEHTANEAQTSYHHLKLLLEYAFGKPKEKLDVTTDGERISIPIINWVDGDK
jgi:hypothetical protein